MVGQFDLGEWAASELSPSGGLSDLDPGSASERRTRGGRRKHLHVRPDRRTDEGVVDDTDIAGGEW